MPTIDEFIMNLGWKDLALILAVVLSIVLVRDGKRIFKWRGR